MAEKFYEKFNKKTSVAKAKNERKEFNRERDKFFEQKRKGSEKKGKLNFSTKISYQEKDAVILLVEKMFEANKITRESRNVLDNFDNIVQGIRPLNSRQFVQLPKDIRALSHQLTDERETRRVGYMNANEELSAYVRYFTWWNLVRLTRVFSNFPADAFNLKDDDYCLDIGSGTLTVVIALWLSRPELREKRLTWYCMDLSSSTMALGEDLYLSIAAKAPAKENPDAHWNIIRVKGSIGTSIKNNARFISCANMYNELSQNSVQKPEETADSQIRQLLAYGTDDVKVFIAEPGMPVSAHFVSLMRDRFIQRDFTIAGPCPHYEECPMSGLHARYGGSAKWCNFDFNTEGAPERLLKLSKDAGIPKERAVISFVFASKKNSVPESGDFKKSEEFVVRIASDPIRLPNKGFGYYACTSKGLALIINNSGKRLESGDKITLSMKTDFKNLSRDKKSGALEINL